MCGICGFNWEDKNLLSQMLTQIAHRGPDSKGKFFDKNISLGHVRLSIIDLSKKGNQPIFNDDSSMLIIYNGELFNYESLRTELLNKGHNFDSETDAEVVLHAYEEYGLDCLSKFNGIFAFCIYDVSNEKMFLARDNLGVKPLYYYKTDKEFIFASEIKAILEHQEIKRAINLQELSAYLSFRYVPGQYTMFDKIMKLLPGHYMIYNLKNKSAIIKSYQDLQNLQKTKISSNKDLVTQLRKQLKSSVNSQMVGDVPIGVFLSGGVDSSSVLALMKQSDKGKDINTFSLGFENREGYENELKYAKLVSEHFGTNHNELTISEKSLNILPQLIFHMDEPVSDATIIPTYFLSNVASKKVKFVLTGEGGDELFGGYVHYDIIDKFERYKKFIIFRNLMSNFIRLIPSNIITKFFNYPSTIGDEGKQRLINLINDSNNKTKTYLNIVSVFDEKDKKNLINKDIDNSLQDEFIFNLKKQYFESNQSLLAQARLREIQTWLPDYILTRLDKIGMSCSLESRVPLLDKQLLTMVNSLSYKDRLNKKLFKFAMKPYLPKNILNRPKYPFTAPIDSWYRKGYKEMAESILNETKEIYQFINKSYVDKILNKREKSNMIHSRQIWSLLTLTIWYQIFIEKNKLKSFKYKI